MSRSDLAILDRDHLMAMTGHDDVLAVEVIEIFQHQTDIWGRMLDPTAESRQWADAAHTLKGAALGIGAMRLAQACEVAEKLGRSGTASKAQAGVALSDVKDQIGIAIEEAAIVIYELTSSGTRKAS